MEFQKIDHQGQFYYDTNNNSTSMAEPKEFFEPGAKAKE